MENNWLSSKWQDNFFNIAKEVGSWSKDPSSKIGAVAVSPSRRILCTGYNGFPVGIIDTYERLHDRDQKYKYMIHAEKNCIYNAVASGVGLKDSHLFVTGLPVCEHCALAVVQSGIKYVYMQHPSAIADKWQESFKETSKIFHEAGVNYVCYKR